MQKYSPIILFLFLAPSFLGAQGTAPTLNAGLSAVTGQRGTLDLELLSEIISAKQEEVRHELIQRLVLKTLDKNSFALQNYLYSSFYSLLTFKDKKAIEKELLTHVTILSLQLGFAEAFYKLSYTDGNTQSKELKRSLEYYIGEAYGINSNVSAIVNEIANRLRSSRFLFVFNLDNTINEVIQEDYKKNGQKGVKLKDPNYRFVSLLFDMIFESIRKNEDLQQRGFVKIHPNLVFSYNSNNTYLSNRSIQYDSLYNLVDGGMSLLVEYHPLFNEFINDRGLSIETLQNQNPVKMNDVDRLSTQIQDMTHWLDSIKLGIQRHSFSSRPDDEGLQSISDELDIILKGVWDFKKRTDAPGITSQEKVSVNDYYFITHIVDPFISKMISQGIFGREQYEALRQVKDGMFSVLLKRLVDTVHSNESMEDIVRSPIELYGPLIKIITSLSKLDRVGSYEHIFNTLAQVGINNLDRTELSFVKDIIYFLESYTTIDLHEGQISVAVEPLLIKILTLYENRVSSDVQLYFSVGVGQTFDVWQKPGIEPIVNSDGVPLSSLALASEKIGVKLKIFNVKKIRSKNSWEVKGLKRMFVDKTNHRNMTPIISDIYAQAYGSGLLYNVANLTTAGKNFDYVLGGLSLGIAFFNALDFNVWVATPIGSGENFRNPFQNRQFWGFSFDIKLTEYLSAIAEKRSRSPKT